MTSRSARMRPVSEGDRAAVLGAGRSGMGALRLLCRLGAKTRLLERDEKNISAKDRAFLERNKVQIICGEHEPQHFTELDLLVLSPGVPVAKILPLLPDSPAERPEVLAEMELAWRQLRGEPVIAVTGTSGKTTTASLAAAMLRLHGLSVFLGGNIGAALSEYVLDGRQADVLVLEISSFQLQTCSSFHPKVGVLLNISENHLDYHADMREYIEAKFRLFRLQDEGDLAVFGKGLEPLVERMRVKSRRRYFEPCGRFSQTQLFGQHNQANMEAAYQACREFGVSAEKAAQAVAAFKPLPHRLERVDEKEGVLFVNDSKCTTVTALKVALEAFDRPVRLLAGGKFKGGDLASLRDLIKERVRVVGLFGASREHYEQAWRDVVPLHWSPSLEEAVRILAAGAQTGDVVLLAPAAASFDLYSNYEARGRDFRQIIRGLEL